MIVRSRACGYANNLDRIETIRSYRRIDGAEPSIAALTGRIEVRVAEQVLVTQPTGGEDREVEFACECSSIRVSHLCVTPL